MNRLRWMTSFGLMVAIALSASGAPARAQDEEGAKSIAIGTDVPMNTVAMKNVDGKTVTLADAAGKKGTLVLFICHHCPWVKRWQSRIASIGSAARQRGIGIVA